MYVTYVINVDWVVAFFRATSFFRPEKTVDILLQKKIEKGCNRDYGICITNDHTVSTVKF